MHKIISNKAMPASKKIPANYLGELHNIHLVNFWVDVAEINSLVPHNEKIKSFSGRTLISVIDSKIEKLHPSFLAEPTNFSFQHVAFRLAIGRQIYFLRQFTDRPHLIFGGNIFTNHSIEKATINRIDTMMELKNENHYFNYAMDPQKKINYDKAQFEIMCSMKQAYSFGDEKIKMAEAENRKWNFQPVHCYLMETNFFESAEFASAYSVDETITYKWIAPTVAERLGN